MTITIVEVGPRDGLQNEAVVVDTHTKVEFINRCVAAGVQRIEAASFVNPKRVPQMADGEAVLERLTPDAASYIGLVLNERGFDRAVNTQVDEVNLVVMVTDTFSQLERVKQYYRFPRHLDVDRYDIPDGSGQTPERDLVLGVRELNQLTSGWQGTLNRGEN